jgi:hypothetical protein
MRLPWLEGVPADIGQTKTEILLSPSLLSIFQYTPSITLQPLINP